MGGAPGDRENGSTACGALLIMIIRCVHLGVSMPSSESPVSNWKGRTNVLVPQLSAADNSSPTRPEGEENELEGQVVERENICFPGRT